MRGGAVVHSAAAREQRLCPGAADTGYRAPEALHDVLAQGHFPEAEKDPVIQIASLVTEQGQPAPVVRNVMTLGTCAPIVGAEVMSFSREEDLLKVWRGCSRIHTGLTNPTVVPDWRGDLPLG